jgi:hypothetical protein
VRQFAADSDLDRLTPGLPFHSPTQTRLVDQTTSFGKVSAWFFLVRSLTSGAAEGASFGVSRARDGEEDCQCWLSTPEKVLNSVRSKVEKTQCFRDGAEGGT